MSGTISDWIIKAREKGLGELAESFHSDKLTDYERLKNSGLPVFDDIRMPYSRFCTYNFELMEFLSKYPAFCVRALPGGPDLPRKFEVGLKTFEECKKFLEKVINPEKGDRYDVLISEYGQEEPATRSGIIISRGLDVLVEIADVGLVELSHGDVGADEVEQGRMENFPYRSMRYSTEDEEKRELMWRALQHIRIDRNNGYGFPSIEFMKGYFEFVILDDDTIGFLDYKVNEMYLK